MTVGEHRNSDAKVRPEDVNSAGLRPLSGRQTGGLKVRSGSIVLKNSIRELGAEGEKPTSQIDQDRRSRPRQGLSDP
jgi:hypothetical protein